MRRSLSILALALALALAAPVGAGQVVLTPADSLQAAIDVAAAGETLLLTPGVYHQTFRFVGRDVVVRGIGGAGETVVSGSGLGGPVVICTSGEGPGAVLEGLTVRDGVAVQGGGLFVLGSSPTVRDCVFEGNAASFEGGGAYVIEIGSVPTFEGCVFRDNVAPSGAGAFLSVNSEARFERCRFAGNQANEGGAVDMFAAWTATFESCAFHDNQAVASGGALVAWTATGAALINCTLADNVASGGGAVHAFAGPASVANAIAWGNGAAPLTSSNGTLAVSYSLVEGGFAGQGNLTAAPGFVSRAARDYRLRWGSPAIDAGDTTRVETFLDLAGGRRLFDERTTPDTGLPDGARPPVDLGAYEFRFDARRAAPATQPGTVQLGP